MLKLYSEGIARLKTYELHKKLQVDGKKHLIDIYYKEDQMNVYRDSLVKQFERMAEKVDSLTQNASKSDAFQNLQKSKLLDKMIGDLHNFFEEEVCQDMMARAKSILTSIHSDISRLHSALRDSSEYALSESAEKKAFEDTL